jgi:hypothetical protein
MTFQEWFNDYIKDKPFGSDMGMDRVYDSKKEVWDAAMGNKVIDFSGLNVQHSSYNNVDCYAIRDVVAILTKMGFEVKV